MDDKLSLPNYGGQAVIEGVMMRGAHSVAIAMRAPNKEIVIHTEPLGAIYKSRLSKIPFLRGLVMLWDALGLGMRALTISANTQTGEEEKLEGPALYLTMGVALLVAVALFMLAPLGIGQLSERFLHFDVWASGLLEGLVRLAFMVAYVMLIGRMSEVQRLFSYHGAEHKTINAFEAGAELTPDNVARYSIEHPRCGTAFLLTFILLSVFLFTALSPLPLIWKYASRIILLPVLAGLAYEYLRWTAKHLKNPFVRWIVKPNLALQHMTTREPSKEMLEVAIAAFQAMRAEEKQIAL